MVTEEYEFSLCFIFFSVLSSFPSVPGGRKNIIASVWLDLKLWTVCAEIVHKSLLCPFHFLMTAYQDALEQGMLGGRHICSFREMFTVCKLGLLTLLHQNQQILPSCCHDPCKSAHIVPCRPNSQLWNKTWLLAKPLQNSQQGFPE